jgi:hypothetical protein
VGAHGRRLRPRDRGRRRLRLRRRPPPLPRRAGCLLGEESSDAYLAAIHAAVRGSRTFFAGRLPRTGPVAGGRAHAIAPPAPRSAHDRGRPARDRRQPPTRPCSRAVRLRPAAVGEQLRHACLPRAPLTSAAPPTLWARRPRSGRVAPAIADAGARSPSARRSRLSS